jgi:ParB/RepB/Spo0J family partition protein
MSKQQSTPPLAEVKSLAVDLIEADPGQARRMFPEAGMKELETSIRANGVIIPLIVRPHKDRFRLVAGERRWRAAKAVGLRQVPAQIRDDLTAATAELLALTDNLQREDLAPLEIAEALAKLVDAGLSQVDLAKQLGKDPAWINRHLALREMPESWRDAMIRPEYHTREVLSEAAARELRRLYILDELAPAPTSGSPTWSEPLGRNLIYGACHFHGTRDLRGVRHQVDRFLAWTLAALTRFAGVPAGYFVGEGGDRCGHSSSHVIETFPEGGGEFSDLLNAAHLRDDMELNELPRGNVGKRILVALKEAADRFGSFGADPWEAKEASPDY